MQQSRCSWLHLPELHRNWFCTLQAVMWTFQSTTQTKMINNMKCTILLLTTILSSISHSLPQGSQSQQPKCSSFQSKGFHCVKFNQCDSNGFIVTDGSGDNGISIFDPRQNNEAIIIERPEELNAVCDKLIEVCCRELKETPPPPLTKNTPVVPRTCGKRNEEGVGIAPRRRLRKGVTRFGEWPHVCAILKQDKTTETLLNIYQCSASLLSKGVVLTVAHCVKNAKNNKEKIFVRCGEWNTANEDESLPYQEIEVAEIIIHPDFNEKNLHNDFALLITDEDFVLDEHISPVCLPSPGETFGTEDCVSNGWGKDKFGSDGNYQTRLKEVELPLVGNQECQRRLRDTRLGQYFKLDDSFICAGGERGVDTCKGDGGGPLSCRRRDSEQWVQAGIVAWGIGCGDDIPAVYANVAKAACWIDREVTCYLQDTSMSYFGLSQDDCQGDYAIGNCRNTAVPF